jgi:hypothetical protein
VKLGFCDQWVSLVMDCVISVSYHVLINGKPIQYINPSEEFVKGTKCHITLICYF